MKKFKKIYIETTNICNLKCNFCPQISRKLEFMSVDSFSKIINKIAPYTNHVYLHLMGEPFLNSNFSDFLNICEENLIKVNITTNGTLINNVKEILLNSKSVRQVNFSLHSFEANEHKVTFEEYVDGILNFIKISSKETDIISVLRLWNLDAKYKASNNMNKNILNLLEEKFDLDCDLKEKLKEKNSFKLRNNVYINMGEKFKWPSLKEEEMDERVFCYGLRDHIGILVDGTVAPCCLDSEGSIPLGNIFENDLEEIINCDRAKKIYDGFSNKTAVEELCRKCGFISRVR